MTTPVGALVDPGCGLTENEAAARLAADGANELPRGPALGWGTALLHQVRDVMIMVLLVAAGVTAVVGDLADTVVIAAVVVINSVLGAVQEVRAGRAVDALADLTAPRATVVRDGVSRDIAARDVVVGDRLVLCAGDIVAADARLLTAESLQLDESLLTGESEPVTRAAGEPVHAGTVATRGRAQAEVCAVAGATEVGAIARAVHRTGPALTPVQRQLAALGRRLAWAATGAAAAVAVLNLSTGHGVETSLVLAVSLAVAAIPESLPAVVSVSLALAARRLTARGVLVRTLSAVEALGSVTVMATDKTGTLTTGHMSLAEIWTPPGVSRAALLTAAVLCNDAASPGENGRQDDPTETALVEGAVAAGLDVAAVRARRPRVAETPFDAATARMVTEHVAVGDGTRIAIVKGSPESVLGLGVTAGAGEMPAAAGELTERGRRVLAVARRDGDRPWRLLGLLGLVDPPRPQARETVEGFRRAGVRPVMITGDHPRTARAIAHAIGLTDEAGGGVHARVRPDGKTAIIVDLQAAGEIVAMTGDGVNDAPALRAADIGVAMGRRGTQVAQQAADIVLTDDDLSAMVPAIGEGRRVYDNLRRFLHYGLAGGLAEILVMLLGPAFGFAMPLRSGQILWVNLLTHGVTGVAMGNEPAAPDVSTRPPRPPREHLLDGRTVARVAVLGSAITAVCLGVAGYGRWADRPWQGMLFFALGLSQLAVALALRPRGRRRGTGGGRNPGLLAAVAGNALLAGLAVTWPPLCDLLRVSPLAPRDLAPGLLAAALVAGVARLQVVKPGLSRTTSRASRRP